MRNAVFRWFAGAVSAAFINPMAAAAAEYTIFIATWRGCEAACQGFQDYLIEAGVDAEFVLRDAGSDTSKIAINGDFVWKLQ